MNYADTIIALATPPGISAIGVIRMSGDEAIQIINNLFPSKDLSAVPTHTLHVGYLKEEDEVLDEVVISIFQSPKSFTGENVVEISCHGSPFVQQRVVEACIRGGARTAKAGEFTQRAFINGKMDLTQAEAVADLIASNTAAAQRTAINNMRGGFSKTLKELREELLRFSALIELELDFATEDVEFADRLQLQHLVDRTRNVTRSLADSFRLGNVIRNGVSVAIIGKPNAGKSTLLNALLNEERAIVSDIAGTTRDTIEEVINIDGIMFRLIDTAGIRAHTDDSIESAGIERSRKKMAESGLVLYILDLTNENRESLLQLEEEISKTSTSFLIVGNKMDSIDPVKQQQWNDASIVNISAKEGIGIKLLQQRMVASVLQEEIGGENVIVTNARHYEALLQVQSALDEVAVGLADKIPGDLLALDIRRALHYLGEITGEITNEEVLGWIFSKFCIGK